ncbi:MAG TPA: Ku protein [Limnochordales bacterium]
MGAFRSLWRATVSFGLVSIPVKVYAATEDREIHLRQLHRRCHSPIEYRKWCPVCDVQVQAEEIVMGYPLSPGRFVAVEDEDLAALPLPEAHTIRILDFAALAEVDPLYFDRPYYLEPAEGGVRPYRLLVEAMGQTGRVAVARMAMRHRESLAALRVLGEVLVLQTMRFADEVRPPTDVVDVPAGSQPDERERQMAVQLVQALSSPFDPTRYVNERRRAFVEMLERKAAGQAVVQAPRAEPPAVADLVEALQASLRELDGAGQRPPALANGARHNGDGRGASADGAAAASPARRRRARPSP